MKSNKIWESLTQWEQSVLEKVFENPAFLGNPNFKDEIKFIDKFREKYNVSLFEVIPDKIKSRYIP